MSSDFVRAPARPDGRPGFRATDTHVDVQESMPYVASHAFAFQDGATAKPEGLSPPSRPFFGGHCIAEAGGALCVPKAVMLLLRSAVFAAGVLIAVFAGQGAPREAWLVPLYSWLSATALSIACSLRYVVARTPEASLPKHIEGSSFVFLANLTVPVYQFALAVNLFSAPLVFFAFKPSVGLNLSRIAVTAFPAVVMLVDAFLSLRHRFKLFYAILPIIYGAVYLSLHRFVFPEAVYPNLDSNQRSSGAVAIYYGTAAGWAVLSSLLLYMFNRCIGLARLADPLTDEIRFARDTRLFTDEDKVATLNASHETSGNDSRVSSQSTDEDVFDPDPSAMRQNGASGPGDLPASGPRKPNRSSAPRPRHAKTPGYDMSQVRGAGPYRPPEPYLPPEPQVPSEPLQSTGAYDLSRARGSGPYRPPPLPPQTEGRDTQADYGDAQPTSGPYVYNPQAPQPRGSLSTTSANNYLFPPLASDDIPELERENFGGEDEAERDESAFPAYPAYPAYPGDLPRQKPRRARRQNSVSFSNLAQIIPVPGDLETPYEVYNTDFDRYN